MPPENHAPDPQAVPYNGEGRPMGDHGISDHDIASLVTPAGGDPAIEQDPSPELVSTGEAEPQADPVVEIPGVGPMKVSEFMALKERAETAEQYRSQVEEFESVRDELLTREQQLREAAKLQDFLTQYPQARERISKALQEIVTNPDDLMNGNGERDAIPEPVKRQLDEVTQFVQAQKAEAAKREVDSIFDGFKNQYPDIVTDDFMANVVDTVDKLAKSNPNLPKMLDRPMLEAIIAKEILNQGIPAAKEAGRQEVTDALRKLPKGAQVVTGHGTHKAGIDPPRDPRSMSRRDIQAEVAEALFYGNTE